MAEFPKAATTVVADNLGRKRIVNLQWKAGHVLAGQLVVFADRYQEKDFNPTDAEPVNLVPQSSHVAFDYNKHWTAEQHLKRSPDYNAHWMKD
jgi:hypothetical protein